MDCDDTKCKWYLAYHILMDYFDEISEESKIELDRRLKEIEC